MVSVGRRQDPEHPYTLEQLKVVQPELITVHDGHEVCWIQIQYMPTVPHCSLATLIGTPRDGLERAAVPQSSSPRAAAGDRPAVLAQACACTRSLPASLTGHSRYAVP